jgi:hypothetical protein
MLPAVTVISLPELADVTVPKGADADTMNVSVLFLILL